MSKTLKIQKPGFLLLELLVAMVVMTIVWFVIARYQNGAIQTIYNAQQRMRAVSLASTLLDEVSTKKNILNISKKEINGFTVTWNVRSRPPVLLQDLSHHQVTQNSKQFNMVTVNVAWNNSNHIQSIQLTSGMAFNKESQ